MEYLTYKQFITRYPDWFKMGTCYQEYLDEYYYYKNDYYEGHIEGYS